MAAKKKSVKKKSAPAKKKPVARKSGAKKAPASAKRKVSASKGKKPARPVRKSKRPAPKRKVPAKVSKAPRAPKVAPPAAPEAFAMAKAIAQVAAEKKATDIMVIDTRSRSSAVGYDYVVLASGESDRQLSAIHEGVEQLLKPQGKLAASVEASPDWVCVNYDVGVVAHFLTPDKRGMMDFEGMWHDAPRVTV